MKLTPKTIFIFVITLTIFVAGYLFFSKKSAPSLADLYYGGNCFRIQNGESAKISQSMGLIVFHGTIENACNHTATLQRIKILDYTDAAFTKLYSDTHSFIPSDAPTTLQPGEKVNFSYELKISGDEVNGFHFYKLVGEAK